jgi:hypothetical protein
MDRYIAPQDNTYVQPAGVPKPRTFWDVLMDAKMNVKLNDNIQYDPEFTVKGPTEIVKGPQQDNYLETVMKYMRTTPRAVVKGTVNGYQASSDALGSVFDALVSPEDRADAQQYYQGVSDSENLISAKGALADLAGVAAGPGAEFVRSSVADPLNLLTLPLGASRLKSLVTDLRYTPMGWKLADKVDDVVNPGEWVETPNYSRMGSSSGVIGMAGNDANMISIDPNYTPKMEPVEAHLTQEAMDMNRGRTAVGNGNHRMMYDRLLGSKTLADDLDIISPVPGGFMLGHRNWPGFMSMDVLGPNITDAASGRRLVKIPGLVDVNKVSGAEIDAISNARAAAATKMADKPLEELLFGMSDGYSFPGAGKDVEHGGFLSFYTGKNQNSVILENPFRTIETVGDGTLNPVHQWLLRKETDGTLGRVLGDMGYDDVDISVLAQDDKLAIELMKKLEPEIQADYVNWLSDNKIKPRPQIRWTD